ncbi:OmpA family protein [candidate division KSB1 bacterium]|nr:OmpA family protein [candidate division KSB1 bacterium]MBL7093410.1 OmpA family protein [candidate division KSB1 bacterium]
MKFKNHCKLTPCTFSFHLFLIFLTFVFFVVTNSDVFAQDDIKTRIFNEVDILFTQAEAVQAKLLSPGKYEKAVEKHEKALKDFNRGKSVTDKIPGITELLKTAIENAKVAQVTFSHLLKARDEAIEANSIEFSKDTFEEAEELFKDATKTLEKGTLNKAKERGLKSEKLFREAELNAIKVSIIGNVKKQLMQAEKKKVHKYAPETIKRSQALLTEAESILTSNRSAKTEAKEKAELAEYEVKHAEYLAGKIKDLREDDLNWEKLILSNEEHFAKILTQLGFTPRFDEGFSGPIESSVNAILSLKKENQELVEEITKLDRQIEKLNDEKEEMNIKLSNLKEKEAGLRTKLSLEEKRKEKFRKIESLFNKNEAKVFREGELLKIRLLGLNFASGKDVIDPSYFSLLTKLQRAIRIFPDYHITMEGHTDNKGDDRMNQSLSLRRARAVSSYLMANMGLTDSQISAIGYGESRPIASNESEQGRTQNRRIDVVLSPPN